MIPERVVEQTPHLLNKGEKNCVSVFGFYDKKWKIYYTVRNLQKELLMAVKILFQLLMLSFIVSYILGREIFNPYLINRQQTIIKSLLL